jgi:DNA-3-methyladenine glycosylase I
MTDLQPCPWCGDDTLYRSYHDEEWGVPQYNDTKLYEFLILEGAQAGLSWITVLRKREGYRQLFDSFDPEKIARYDEKKIDALKQDARIIRNDAKIRSAIKAAQLFLDLRDKGVSFRDYLWQFVDGTPIQNHWESMKEVPALTPVAEKMSKQLKKDGFNFVGPTICYAHMQATGMVNDHLVSCPRHRECADHPGNY